MLAAIRGAAGDTTCEVDVLVALAGPFPVAARALYDASNELAGHLHVPHRATGVRVEPQGYVLTLQLSATVADTLGQLTTEPFLGQLVSVAQQFAKTDHSVNA